jgi:small conductance mechanosensitive channel
MNIDFAAVTTYVVTTVTQLGLKVVGAIVVWVVGKMLINFVLNLIGRALERQHVDTTVSSYLRTSVSVVLRIGLAMALLGFFGVETSSFAALIAAGGVAIGLAWSGLLSNFAAGVFLVILRPFAVDDFVTVGGVTGTVKVIGLFGTTVDTPDGVMTVVGNGKIFSETIQNFSANKVRRVDLTAQLPLVWTRQSRCNCYKMACDTSPTLRPIRRPRARSSPSTRRVRCWWCAPTPTTRITGRSISTPTG